MKYKILLTIFAIFSMFLACSEDDTNPIGNPDDTIAPGTISTLEVIDQSGSSVTLRWIAVGGDGMIGRARSYDIRYSTSPIDDTNFDLAVEVPSTPYPRVIGYEEVFEVTSLNPETVYYFAIKVGDAVPNWSEISNVVSATTDIAGEWIIFNSTNTDLISNEITDFAFISNTRYFGTTEGLGIYDGSDWNILQKDTNDIDNSIAGDNISALIIGQNNQLWIGSKADGLSLLNGTNFTNYFDSTSGLTTNAIRALEFDDFHNLWIGTGQHGLFKYKNDVWTHYNTTNSNIGANSISALKIHQNDLWIGFSFGGASYFDGINFTNYNTTNGLPSNAVWDIEIDSDNNVWFATEAGVAVLKTDNSWLYYNTGNSGLIDNVVLTLEVSHPEKWIGTRYGLNKFENNSWKLITTQNSRIPANFISVLKRDITGNLYIGTKNGAAIFTNF